jgi:hypothetical protein
MGVDVETLDIPTASAGWQLQETHFLLDRTQAIKLARSYNGHLRFITTAVENNSCTYC